MLEYLLSPVGKVVELESQKLPIASCTYNSYAPSSDI